MYIHFLQPKLGTCAVSAAATCQCASDSWREFGAFPTQVKDRNFASHITFAKNVALSGWRVLELTHVAILSCSHTCCHL